MEVIGYYSKQFTANDGKIIRGIYLILGNEIKSDRGEGLYPDKPIFIGEAKLNRMNYTPVIGQQVKPIWNRDGKLEDLIVL